eukprot:COSAG01_NODE_19145_length_1028_cov_0.794403_2_plen_125_part_00
MHGVGAALREPVLAPPQQQLARAAAARLGARADAAGGLSQLAVCPQPGSQAGGLSNQRGWVSLSGYERVWARLCWILGQVVKWVNWVSLGTRGMIAPTALHATGRRHLDARTHLCTATSTSPGA